MRFLLLASDFMTVNTGLIFWTILTFIVVAVVLRWKAWGPILSLVEEREKQITNAIESAKRERSEAEKALAEAKAANAQARQEAADAIRQNKAEMDKLREQMTAEARKKAEEELTTARRQIQEEKVKAIAEVKAIAVDLALRAAERLISEKMDDTKHRAMAEQFIEQLPKDGGRRNA